MSAGPHESVRKKVEDIFREMSGERSRNLEADHFPAAITTTVTNALIGPEATEAEILRADELAFHLTDWGSDAAFLVALHLYPERFSKEEIEAGVEMFLIHVPAHVMAAARLAGHPVKDIFNESGS